MGDAVAMIAPRMLSPRDVTQAEIQAICTLKNQSWPHSMESQLTWWEENTAEDDLLVTMVRGSSILAFLRLRSRAVSVSGERLDVLCATEVCVDEAHQRQGLGARLMGAAATRIGQTASRVGYLLCRDIQEPFYAACGWRRTDAPLQIESTTGAHRPLAANERCMTCDPLNRLNGPIVLFGDVF